MVDVRDEEELELALERIDPEIFLLSPREAEDDETHSTASSSCCPTCPRASSRSPTCRRRRGTRCSRSSAPGVDAVLVGARRRRRARRWPASRGLSAASPAEPRLWGGPRSALGAILGGSPRRCGGRDRVRAAVRQAAEPGRAEHRPARLGDRRTAAGSTRTGSTTRRSCPTCSRRSRPGRASRRTWPRGSSSRCSASRRSPPPGGSAARAYGTTAGARRRGRRRGRDDRRRLLADGRHRRAADRAGRRVARARSSPAGSSWRASPPASPRARSTRASSCSCRSSSPAGSGGGGSRSPSGSRSSRSSPRARSSSSTLARRGTTPRACSGSRATGWLGFEHDHVGARRVHRAALGRARPGADRSPSSASCFALRRRTRADLILASFVLVYFVDLLTLARALRPLHAAARAAARRARRPAAGARAGDAAAARRPAASGRSATTPADADRHARRRARAGSRRTCRRGRVVAAESSTPRSPASAIAAAGAARPRTAADPNRDVARLRAEGVRYVLVTGAVADRVLAARDRYPREARFYDQLRAAQRVYQSAGARAPGPGSPSTACENDAAFSFLLAALGARRLRRDGGTRRSKGEVAATAAKRARRRGRSWQKLANRIDAPVYCPGWMPDPLDGPDRRPLEHHRLGRPRTAAT